MKKILMVLVVLAVSGAVAVQAQGGQQRRTVEERVQAAHQKLDSAFKLEKAKITEADSVFAVYYRAQDKLREELMASGSQDFQAMREKMQPLADERDKKLQAILTADQYKIWKDQIEELLRPRRGGGRN